MNILKTSGRRIRLCTIVPAAFLLAVTLSLAGVWGLSGVAGADVPDFTVTKTADQAVIDAGDAMSFTIEVTNNSSSDWIDDLEIKDLLPVDFYWGVGEGWENCNVVPDDETGGPLLDCSFSAIAPGDTVTVTIQTKTTLTLCSTYRNSATATATNESGTTVRESNEAVVTCRAPQLTLTKTPGKETVLAGEDISFTITFTNQGPGVIEDWNLSLEDQLPGGTAGPWEIVDGPKDGEGNDLCEIYENEGQYELDCFPFGELGPGDSFTVTVKAPTSTRLCSTYHNTARVFEGGHGDGQSESPVATAEATVTCRQPAPGLVVTKTAVKPTVNAGEDAAFTIETSSTGELAAGNVTLTDALPGGTAGDWTVTDQPSGNPCSIAGGTMSCLFGNLAPGQSRKVTVTAPTSTEQCGTYENTVTASATDLPDVSAKATVTCVKPTPPPPPPPPPPAPKPKLQLRVEANRSVVRPGQRVRWTVSVRNRRKGSVAKNLRVCDRIAPRMVVTNPGGGHLSQGRICWPIKRLKGAAGWTRFHYTTRVTLDARHGDRPRDQASLGNLRAHAQVKVKLPPKPKPPKRTPVTG